MKYELIQDTDCECPLDKDDAVKITYWHKARTILGTESVDEARLHELAKLAKAGTIIRVPVWAYVHSGTALKAAWENPFSCPWDSGRSGIVYIDKKQALKDLGFKRMSANLHSEIIDRLKFAVDEYGQWLNGECYGYRIIDDDGRGVIDSLWGLIGREYAESEAKQALADCEKDRAEALLIV